MKHFLRLLILALTLVFFAGCVFDKQAPNKATSHFLMLPVDYAERGNWVMLPEASAEMREVDVFYVYPTLFSSKTEKLMRWDTDKIRAKARAIAGQQTGPFKVGNIYAPFVRQTELFTALEDMKAERITGPSQHQAVADTVEAFRYYMKHHNNGRPFILVGHSQGAYDLLKMMKLEFKDESLQRKLVAAYLIGFPVTADDFEEYPHLKPARGEYDTGVIISWNTEAPDAVKSVFTGRPGTYCINPLNWKTDATPATAVENLGAVLFDYKTNTAKEYPNFCSAVINPDTGALIAIPQYPGQYDNEYSGKGIYHGDDIYFFYRNLEVNAKARASAYFR